MSSTHRTDRGDSLIQMQSPALVRENLHQLGRPSRIYTPQNLRGWSKPDYIRCANPPRQTPPLVRLPSRVAKRKRSAQPENLFACCSIQVRRLQGRHKARSFPFAACAGAHISPNGISTPPVQHPLEVRALLAAAAQSFCSSLLSRVGLCSENSRLFVLGTSKGTANG